MNIFEIGDRKKKSAAARAGRCGPHTPHPPLSQLNHTLRKLMLEWVAAHQPHNMAAATTFKATGKKKMRPAGKKRRAAERDEDEE